MDTLTLNTSVGMHFPSSQRRSLGEAESYSKEKRSEKSGNTPYILS